MPVSGRHRWYDHLKVLSARGVRSHAVALAGFTAITVALTYPIASQMGSAVRHHGDPVFNSWVIAENARSLVTGNPQGLFDANIFFPAPNTAAYSEFLIPQSLIAAPVRLVSDNPILAYNFVLLVAFITSAFGAYLLASHLTGQREGFVAGLIFAFNPFMMDHLSHVQVLSAAGIPLALLYLHKFLTDGRTSHLLAFSLFYVVQALANSYYALYLTLFAGLYILINVVQRRRYFDVRFWLQIALHVSISLLVAGPFFLRYFVLRRDFGMMIRREDGVSRAVSFIATSPINRLYGNATEAYFKNEAALFPGLCALLLAAIAICFGLALRKRRLDHTGPPYVAIVYRVTTWILALLGVLVVEIVSIGGIDTTIGSIPIRASSLGNPVGLIIVLMVIRLVLKRRYAITSSVTGTWDTRLFYMGMLALAVIMTIPAGPSTPLHHYVPGFDALRGVNRIHIMSMLAVSVLAAYGIAALSARLSRGWGAVLTAILGLVIVIEYNCVPIPLVTIPSSDDTPAVYQWLASQEEDFAFVEYPILSRLQVWQVFFSTYHWKRLVTGASAFPSKTYIALRRRKENVPSSSTLEDFERIGVRYLVVHEWPSENIAADQLQAGVDLLSDRLRLVTTLDSYDVTLASNGDPQVNHGGRARVYELTRSEWQPPRLVRSLPARTGAMVLSSDRAQWTLSASTNPNLMRFAVDGDLSTRWYSLQRPAQFFQVDLGQETLLNGLVLDVSSRHALNSPRGYRVDASRDGQTWENVAENPAYLLPLTEALRPKHYKVDIPFPAITTRHVRIVQTGTDVDYRWSISELNFTAPPGSVTVDP